MLSATFENTLPDTLSQTRRGYKFTRGEIVCGGTVVFQAKGHVSRYWVEEVPSDLAGRGFRFVKVLVPGQEGECEVHDVFVADGEQQHDDCSCRGFVSHGTCKHMDIVKDLLAHGELPALTEADADALCDPDADCGSCEFEDVYADFDPDACEVMSLPSDPTDDFAAEVLSDGRTVATTLKSLICEHLPAAAVASGFVSPVDFSTTLERLWATYGREAVARHDLGLSKLARWLADRGEVLGERVVKAWREQILAEVMRIETGGTPWYVAD